MRFEVQYPTGALHEVELQGTIAVLGRDPSCDLVLNNPKCSRRHAVLEAGPGGITIRDSGSANGVYVNGKRVERAHLHDGDVVRLGEVQLRVLPEDVPHTMVMGPAEIAEFAPQGGATPAPAGRRPAAPPDAPRAPQPPLASARGSATPRPPPSDAGSLQPTPEAPGARPRTPPSARSAGRADARPARRSTPGSVPRPPTVVLLAALWGLSLFAYPAAAAAAGWSAGARGVSLSAAVLAGVGLGLISGVMAWGLWSLKPWARVVQIAIAAAGLLVCPVTLASALVLAYMLRRASRLAFSGRALEELDPAEQDLLRGGGAEPAFALGILATLVLGLAVAGGAYALRGDRPVAPVADDAPIVQRLRSVAAAQRAFRAGTCGGFADLEGLLRPATVIPNYPPSGPPFLDAEFASALWGGYRFVMSVADPLPPSEGCPPRAFRRYLYSATPSSGSGRHFLVGSDGVVRAARGRPADPSDPPVEAVTP